MAKQSFRVALWAPAFVLIICALAQIAEAGVIVTRDFNSPALGRKWSYSIYLPTGYDEANLKYPTLYLLHGNGGNSMSFVNNGIQASIEALITSGDIPPTVVVMPDAGTSWYVDRKEKMETAVINDLIPDVEKNFKVLTSRNGRLLAGLSMGGYGAMRFALKYPEMFVAAALFYPAIYKIEPPQNSAARTVGVFGSPNFDRTIWNAYNYPALWDSYLAKKLPVPMFISSGDDDDFFIEAEATQLYSLLRKNTQPAQLRIVDGTHEYAVVEKTIQEAFKYIFSYAARPTIASTGSLRPNSQP